MAYSFPYGAVLLIVAALFIDLNKNKAVLKGWHLEGSKIMAFILAAMIASLITLPWQIGMLKGTINLAVLVPLIFSAYIMIFALKTQARRNVLWGSIAILILLPGYAILQNNFPLYFPIAIIWAWPIMAALLMALIAKQTGQIAGLIGSIVIAEIMIDIYYWRLWQNPIMVGQVWLLDAILLSFALGLLGFMFKAILSRHLIIKIPKRIIFWRSK